MLNTNDYKHLVGQTFDYTNQYGCIPYRICSVIKCRYTNIGIVCKVYVLNTVTELGGRYMDVDTKGNPFHFSPD